MDTGGIALLQLQKATSSLVQSIDLPESSPHSNMIGRVNELEAMKNRLMDISSDETQVVAIVGMGGIGKTTFARRIYDDPAIKSHFDILARVTMSKEYCIRRMLLQLLHCIPSTNKYVIREEMDDGDLAGKLKQALWKRRYLVVIDDIWSTDAWDDISQWFPADCRGSHVLLTTRCANVASYAAPSKPPHHISFLNAKQSWELLQSKVHVSSELTNVGKKIADNCHGLPLTVIVVAGLLSKFDDELERWEQVAQDVKSAIFNDPAGRQCEKVLALSYCYLPQHLKACFLYFGRFLEDEEVNTTRLISLWVAEGLVKEADDHKSLEDVAEECLQELIDRNLVLIGQLNFCGEVETCKIHDLLHEFCLRQARAQNDNSLPVISNVSRRSFIQVCLRIVRSIRSKFKNFEMIRVLDLRKIHGGVPTSILFDLVHLRYLHLFIRIKDKCLPRFKLQNLQVLIVEIENSGSVTIHIDIQSMPQLRNVHFIKGWRCLPNMHRGEGKHKKLEHLHTITGVGPSWCKSEIFALMPNLKKLEVVSDRAVGLETVLKIYDDESREFFLPSEYRDNLRPDCLKKLDVVFDPDDDESHDLFLSSRVRENFMPNKPANDDYFENLRTFPPTLTRLTLCGLFLNWEAMDIVGILPNLEALELKDNACGHISGTTWKLSRVVFSRVKFLSLRNMGFFKEWKAIDDHFPVLERLCLSHCRWLKKIPQKFADIPTLQVIELRNCSVNLAESAKQIQQEQEDNFGCPVTNVSESNCNKYGKIIHILSFNTHTHTYIYIHITSMFFFFRLSS